MTKSVVVADESTKNLEMGKSQLRVLNDTVIMFYRSYSGNYRNMVVGCLSKNSTVILGDGWNEPVVAEDMYHQSVPFVGTVTLSG